VFAVNQLDAARLRQGLADLEAIDSGRAAAIRNRARIAIQRMAAQFPGDAKSGILDERVFHAGSKAEARFEQFGNDEICPVLNSNTGRCELYNSRPMTCRTFGPPVRSEDGLGVCELCFHGATDEQIADCEMVADPEDLEADVLRELERETDARGRTIVAYCVR
jgi:Fe-S-cluster containining protein